MKSACVWVAGVGSHCEPPCTFCCARHIVWKDLGVLSAVCLLSLRALPWTAGWELHRHRDRPSLLGGAPDRPSQLPLSSAMPLQACFLVSTSSPTSASARSLTCTPVLLVAPLDVHPVPIRPGWLFWGSLHCGFLPPHRELEHPGPPLLTRGSSQTAHPSAPTCWAFVGPLCPGTWAPCLPWLAACISLGCWIQGLPVGSLDAAHAREGL